jgi:hypothetical protein
MTGTRSATSRCGFAHGEDRLGLLVDREAVERERRRLVTRLKFANLRQNAIVEDVNTKAARAWRS